MKKLIAGLLTALMAFVPLVSAVELGNYPTFLAEDGKLDALVVIGSEADVGDVVGAVDLAVRLAETGEEAVAMACAASSGAVSGTEKDTVALSGALSAVFPSSGVLKTAHYSGLKDSSISWRGTDYDYREQVDFGAVSMSHDLAVSNVNGTEKMLVASGNIKYQFVFDKQLNISSAGGTGSVDTPEYSYPVNIKMLGQDFSIVGVSSNQVKMLHGSIGTATATTPVVYGDYSVYSDLGSDASWARAIIKDADDNTVDTLTVNSGASKQSSATGLTVQVTAVRALQDGTVVGADLVVGPTSEGVAKTYDVTADVTSTGTASDRFPGETAWGIQVASGTFATSGLIAVGDTLEVVYKPTTTQYLLAGEMVSLPNSYGELKFEGWNTDKFATITVDPLDGTIAAYNLSADTQAFGNLGGIEITSDVGGTIVSTANTGYDKAYVLFNYSRTGVETPVMIGFYDSSKQKILVNGTIQAVDDDTVNTEYVSKIVNLGGIHHGVGNDTVDYAFKLSYGNAADDVFYLNITVGGNETTNMITSAFAGTSATAASITFGFKNKTTVSTSQAPEFKLGATAASAEATEINATTHSSEREAGKKTQEIVDDSGLILLPTDSYGASDKVAFKVPFKALKAKVYFGTKGEGTAASEDSYTSYPSIPVSSAIARLDTELTEVDKASNLIAVGGPAVNSVAAEALGLEFPTYGAEAAEALGIAEGEGVVSAMDNPYAAGKVVVVVAGWDVTATRAAAAALQQYDTQLAGVTEASFTV